LKWWLSVGRCRPCNRTLPESDLFRSDRGEDRRYTHGVDYASLIETIRAGVQELPFESSIRSAVVVRRLGSDLPESEFLPGLSETQRVLEAVRRTIAYAHEVHPIPDQWGEGYILVFCRHVIEGVRRWDFEVEVAIDSDQRHAVIADARVTRPDEGFEDSDWTTPAPAAPALPMGLVACACCGHATLTERGLNEICPVCFWEDDGQDNEDADSYRGGPNRVSLREGRVNFLRFGASVEADCESVRRPTAEEVRLRRFDDEGHEVTSD